MKERFTIAVVAAVLIAVLGLLPEAWAAERKESVLPSQLPAKVKKALDETFPNGEILRIETEVQGKDVGQYDVEIRSGGKEYEVEVSPEGKIIESKERAVSAASGGGANSKQWTKEFHIADLTFSSTGRNRFFILEPGHQLVLEGGGEKVAITVLDETEMVGGIETRIIEEREEEDGELKEVSRNYFAICNETGDMFYFGETVDDYEDGKVVRHSGEWRADDANSSAGIVMPGTIFLGARHYQEHAPNAMDRAEILRDDVTMKTPAGTFTNCIRVEETSDLEPGGVCYKTYAPGIGLIQDEGLVLVKYSYSDK